MIVEEGHVDVVGANPGHRVQLACSCAVTRRGEDVIGLLEPAEERVVVPFAAHRRPLYHRRGMAQVAGPLDRRRDHCHGSVGLHGVVEEAQRIGDHPRVEVVLEGQRRFEKCFRPVQRVVALGDADLGEVLTLGPVLVHVPLGEHREVVPRRRHGCRETEGGFRWDAAAGTVCASTPRARQRAGLAGAAAQASTCLLECHEADHDVGQAGGDGRRREADAAGGSPAPRGQRSGEADLGDAEDPCHRAGVDGCHGIESEAVDIGDREPRVLAGRDYRLARHLHGRLRQRLAPPVIGRGADSSDCGLVLQ